MTADPKLLPISELKSADAERLGDLALIVLDLRSVLDICDRLIAELNREEKDQVIIEALWIAALTKYVRCFTTGRRLGLSESLLAEINGAVEAHRYYKNMRDKNVAHSVNPFEEVRVGVVLPNPDSPTQTVQGVATISRRLASGSSEGVSTLRRLAAEVHAKTCVMAETAQNDILAWARQQPLDAFVQRPLGLVTPGSEQAGRAR